MPPARLGPGRRGVTHGHAAADGDGREFAGLCDLLASPTRLRVLLALAACDGACLSGLRAALGVPQPTLSHHLGLLRHQGLVAFRRGSQMHYYA